MADFVEWKEKYRTGVEIIDKEHQTLIEIINKLYAKLQDRNTNKAAAFSEAAHHAVAYVKRHFADEEKWMQENHYPHLSHQKRQHVFFITRLLEDSRRFDEKNPIVAHKFCTFLRDWLMEHIAIEDNEFKYFLKNRTFGKR